LEAVLSVAELSDRAQIEETLWLYIRGVDQGDMAMAMEAFWPDATDDHARFYGGTVDDIVPTMEAMRQRLLLQQSAVSNLAIEIDGEIARSEALVVCHHRYIYEDNEYEWLACGRYIDRHEKREGVWKVAHRQNILDWEKVTRIEQTMPPESLLQV
jgi:hypothetical protein